jgi:hypothetical protein
LEVFLLWDVVTWWVSRALDIYHPRAAIGIGRGLHFISTKYGWIYMKQTQNDNLYYKIRLDLYETNSE